MGLDITAYGNVAKVSDLTEDREADWEKAEEMDGCILTKNDSFPEHCLDLKEAIYQVNGECHGFRAGSYSGYTRFRNLLSEVILGVNDLTVWTDIEKFKDSPFYELINFSDCEGAIGPSVSAKLYGDFVANEEKFVKALDTQKDQLYVEWIKTCYTNWKRAFEIAKDHGFVSFH